MQKLILLMLCTLFLNKMKYHKGLVMQRGHGFGGVFKFLGKLIAPVVNLFRKSAGSIAKSGVVQNVVKTAKKAATSRVAKDIAKTTRDSLIEAGLNTAADALTTNSDLKKATGQNVETAKKKIADSIRKGAKTYEKKTNLSTVSTKKPVKRSINQASVNKMHHFKNRQLSKRKKVKKKPVLDLFAEDTDSD